MRNGNKVRTTRGAGILEWAVVVGAVVILVGIGFVFMAPLIGKKLQLEQLIAVAASSGKTASTSVLNAGFFGYPRSPDTIAGAAADPNTDLGKLTAACVAGGAATAATSYGIAGAAMTATSACTA